MQAREIFRHAAEPDFPFDPDLIQYISPIEWKNVVLYGEIRTGPNRLWIPQPLVYLNRAGLCEIRLLQNDYVNRNAI